MCLVGTECDVESIDSRRFKQSGNHRERISSTKHDIGWIDTVGMSPYLPSRKIVRMFRKICPFYSSDGEKKWLLKKWHAASSSSCNCLSWKRERKKERKKKERSGRETQKNLPLPLEYMARPTKGTYHHQFLYKHLHYYCDLFWELYCQAQ